MLIVSVWPGVTSSSSARQSTTMPCERASASAKSFSFLLKQKENDFADALARSQGIVVDCLADDELVTPGQTLTISIQAYAEAATQMRSATLNLPQGWAAQQQQ